MKGLLLKDWYALCSYLKTFLILDVVFLAMAAISEGNTFMLFYPSLLAGMLSMTLIAYEEKEKWTVYVQTLPYTKAQLVSAKYLVSLLLGTFTLATALTVQAVAMMLRGHVDITRLGGMATTLISLSLVPAAILLPFIYRFGVEKGRIAYYVMIGGFCAGLGMLGGFDGKVALFGAGLPGTLVCLGALVLFGASWLLSISFYNRREL